MSSELWNHGKNADAEGRLKRRDWFVDAGPVGPASGIVAAFTTSFTVAIGGVSDYIRNISVIKHKDSKSDRSPSPERERRLSLTKIESNNPVSQAANYSPEHIAVIAYKMAAKSIPATAEERRKRREQLEREYQLGQKDPAANVVKPGRTMSRNKALFGASKKTHSKARDAAIETGHFVDNMVEVGLKGVYKVKADLICANTISACCLLLQYRKWISQHSLLFTR